MQTITKRTHNVEQTKQLGTAIGAACQGGEVIVLESDLGGGKTTFTKGIAEGMGITEVVQSPTFTISQQYTAPSGLALHHYDFYRLQDAGILRDQLAESLDDPDVVTVIEWSSVVKDVLPDDSIHVRIEAKGKDEQERDITLTIPAIKDYIKHAFTGVQI